MRSDRWPAGEQLGLDATLFFVGFQDVLADVDHFVGIDQGDGTAAEAAASHPRSVNASFAANVFGDIDEQIEFLATDFEVIAKRRMPLIHQITKFFPAACFDRFGSFFGSLDFRNDVPRQWEFGRCQLGLSQTQG